MSPQELRRNYIMSPQDKFEKLKQFLSEHYIDKTPSAAQQDSAAEIAQLQADNLKLRDMLTAVAERLGEICDVFGDTCTTAGDRKCVTKSLQLLESTQPHNTSINSQSSNKKLPEVTHYEKLLDFAKDEIAKMTPRETRYVGRYSYNPGKEDAKETHAKMTDTGKVNFYHKNELSGTLISAKKYDTKSNKD